MYFEINFRCIIPDFDIDNFINTSEKVKVSMKIIVYAVEKLLIFCQDI